MPTGLVVVLQPASLAVDLHNEAAAIFYKGRRRT
jgi:hypothetical protein